MQNQRVQTGNANLASIRDVNTDKAGGSIGLSTPDADQREAAAPPIRGYPVRPYT